MTRRAAERKASRERPLGKWHLVHRGMVDNRRRRPRPRHPAVFVRPGPEQIRGRAAVLFGCSIRPEHSHGTRVAPLGEQLQPAQKGRPWIDVQTGGVLRIERRAVSIPVSFPRDKAERLAEFAPVALAGAGLAMSGGRRRAAASPAQGAFRKTGSFAGITADSRRNHQSFPGEFSGFPPWRPGPVSSCLAFRMRAARPCASLKSAGCARTSPISRDSS